MGEARLKRLLKEAAEQEARADAYANGRPIARPQTCPTCGSPRIGFAMPPAEVAAVLGDVEHGFCLTCTALWEAFPSHYVEDPVCAEPCDNCAFRPGSPEQTDPDKWKALIASLKPDQSFGQFTGRFYCHKNVPIDLDAGPGNFKFPKRKLYTSDLHPDGPDVALEDTSKMRVCSGFLRMVWAQNAKKKFVIEYEDEDGSVRPMGYASTEHGAQLMAEAWRKHPSAVRVWITDRQANPEVADG